MDGGDPGGCVLRAWGVGSSQSFFLFEVRKGREVRLESWSVGPGDSGPWGDG